MTPQTALPTSLKANPRLGQWLTIHADGHVSVRSGKVDLGQGISTALAQLVADGLSVNFACIRMLPASTAYSPNEGVTSGSLSVQDSGSALRHVCAQARHIYQKAAANQLGVAPGDAAGLQLSDGVFKCPRTQRTASYADLADDALLEVDAIPLPETGPRLIAPDQPAQVGTSAPRADIARKVLGLPAFVHDLRLPGMLFGRVVHPPSPSARLRSVDSTAVKAMPGVVAVLQDGDFLGVVASGEYQAVQACAKLAKACEWHEIASLPDVDRLGAFLRAEPLETTLVGERVANPPPADANQHPAVAANHSTMAASYSRPFLAHASIGPACAVARLDTVAQGPQLHIWSHTQGVYNLRADLALLMKLPPESIIVQHAEGAGCYGHNGADDVAADAALLARAVPGQAVQVVWSREDELGVAPFGPAMAINLQATLGNDGDIAQWRHEVWSNGHGLRPGRGQVPVLAAASQVENPFEKQVSVNAPLLAGGGAERNAVPLYDFAQWQAVSHRLLTMPVRSSALRSLGAHGNVFAAESFLDEIAHAQQIDPLALRLQHLRDSRAREVLQAAVEASGWHAGRQARQGQQGHPDMASAEGHGWGLAVTRYKNKGAYCAVVARVDASRELRVTDLWIAVDVGLVINPDGVHNQIEGGAIQTVSWVLREAVRFDDTRITSTAWDTYPILKFSEVPTVSVHIIHRPDQPPVGAGEATHGPVAAAIANALFDATGLRVRDMPFTPDRLQRAALAA
jgi:CO/xanthine dehydrogenase Mo-binding subunit